MSITRRAAHHPILEPALLGISLIALGCHEAEPAPAPTSIAETPQWIAEVDLRIGSVDDAKTMLTNPFVTLTGEHGRFYVTQPQDGNIRIHEADGRLVKTFGRRGDGPGEFQSPGFMGWVGEGHDTLWVTDFRVPRVSWFLADGAHVRTVQVRTEPYKKVMRAQVQAVLADGTGIGWPTFPSRMLADGHITAIPWLHSPLAEGAPELVLESDATHEQLTLNVGNGQSYQNQPFGDGPVTDVSGSLARVVQVEQSTPIDAASARFRVTVVTPTADTVWSREYPYEPVPIPQTESDSVLASVIALTSSFATQDVEAEVKKRLYLPAFRAPFSRVKVASDGSIWLQSATLSGDTVTHWLALTPDGDLLAKLDLPIKVRLYNVEGATAWAVETDELDVPYVVRLRLRPGR